jgi:NAD(P)-dependent dehydrogenase (short-subunit alcohol dehydrogenase family)
VEVKVNVLGVLALFKASYPLLKRSTPTPKFIPISSGAGSIEMGGPLPLRNVPYVSKKSPSTLKALFANSDDRYGTSKAALSFVTRKIRAENDGLGEHIHLSTCRRTWTEDTQYAFRYVQAVLKQTWV